MPEALLGIVQFLGNFTYLSDREGASAAGRYALVNRLSLTEEWEFASTGTESRLQLENRLSDCSTGSPARETSPLVRSSPEHHSGRGSPILEVSNGIEKTKQRRLCRKRCLRRLCAESCWALERWKKNGRLQGTNRVLRKNPTTQPCGIEEAHLEVRRPSETRRCRPRSRGYVAKDRADTQHQERCSRQEVRPKSGRCLS